MQSKGEVKLEIERSGGWARVYADADGKDVSHLSYGPQRVRVGMHAVVTMAGIAGVATDKEYRRRGLAQRVFSLAVEELKREGRSVAGLYTSKRLVAHRLYRRFGLVDVWHRRPAYKVLDPGAFASRRLSSLLRQCPELAARRLTLRLCFDSSRPVCLKIEGSDVTVLSRAPRRLDLSLSMSCATFLGLLDASIGLAYALGAKLVRQAGDPAALQLLTRALAAYRTPVDEE